MTTTGGGWTIFQRRIDGSQAQLFYRNWLDYNNGFGDAAGEFWLGNEYLSILTASNRYLLRVDLGDWSGQYRYAQYNDFKVANGSDKYRLAILGTYSGDAGDSLVYQRGQKFSTYDQDNAVYTSRKCAVYHRGAWWYNSCAYSNLNGEYNNTSGEGVFWYDWLGHYSLRLSEMKIRPVTF